MSAPLNLAELSRAQAQGDYPVFSIAAVAYLNDLPADRCFVATGAVNGKYFPAFMVRLSEATARFCGFSGGVPPEADFKFNSCRDRAGNFLVELVLRYPGHHNLHLVFNPVHPHVRHWLRLACHTEVIGITYTTTETRQYYSSFIDIDQAQVPWFERNLQQAEEQDAKNAITRLSANLHRTLRPAANHRFLTFAERADPAMLMEFGEPFVLESEPDLPWEAAGEYDREWLARKHGISLTQEESAPDPDDFCQRIMSIPRQALETPKTLLRYYQDIARDYPEHPLLLRSLAMSADSAGDRAKYREYVSQLKRIADRSPIHRFRYLEVLLDPENFLPEMDRFPRPHRILDHPAGREDGKYYPDEFLLHEELAGRYECIQGDLPAALLRIDRLVRLGGPTDGLKTLMQGLIIARMDQLDPDTEYGVMFSFTDFSAALRDQLDEATLPLLQTEVVALLEEVALETPLSPIRRSARKVGRNEPCPCGSGKKYKRCCG